MACIAALGMIAVPMAIAADSQPHGTIELVAEESSLQAAKPLHAGLHFKLEKGWHIYWTNPGDSGEPPRVNWSLPPGFSAGPLEWPVPQRIEDHSLVDYGYADEVLLPVEIRPPARFGAETKVQLSAQVHWLVCRETCVPGHADLDLMLPIGRGAATLSNLQHLFAQARADLPRRVPASWKVMATVDQHQWTLNLETGSREADVVFLPLQANQIENSAAQKATVTSNGIRIEIQKSDQMLKPPARLTGVVVLGSKRGYLIDTPVTVSK